MFVFATQTSPPHPRSRHLGRSAPNGFTFVLRVLRGPHTLQFVAHSALTGLETVVTLPLKIS
jgi:hypothetical protein